MDESLIKLDKQVMKEYGDFLIENSPDFSEVNKDSLFRFYKQAEKELKNLLASVEFFKSKSAKYNILGHGKTDFNVNGILTGLRGDMLNKDGKKLAFEQHDNLSKKRGLVFASDVPRAIHHAILRENPDKEKETGRIAVEEVKEGIISKEGYEELIKIAVNLGIIPNPLIRSQYFACLDGYDENNSTKKQKKEAKWRRQLSEAVREANEKEGENYLHLTFERGFSFLEMLVNKRDGIIIPKADIITHSGFFDSAQTYFSYLDSLNKIKEGLIELGRTKSPNDRGRTAIVKLDYNLNYINNHEKLVPVKKETLRKTKDLRNLSLDEYIKDNSGIVETPLLAFKDENETYKSGIEEALDSPTPVLIFGHGGQGKTILLTETVRKLIVKKGEDEEDKKFKKKYANHIPIIVNCRDINKKIKSNRVKNDAEGIAKLIKEDTKGIPEALLKEYKIVFLIDDYHKVNEDYQSIVRESIERVSSEENSKVLIFSRLERTDVRLPINKGYLTMQIDRDSIYDSIDEFIEKRIGLDKRAAFKRHLLKYDASIKGNFITLFALTRLYDDPESVLDYFDEEEDKELYNAIKSGKQLRRTQLYEIETQFVIGRNIEDRHDGELPIEEVRKEIKKEKERLSELAYGQIFDKNNGK